jgi:hypothetical protein
MVATASDIAAFRSRFPEFAATGDADIASQIAMADVVIDGSQWPRQVDYVEARLLYAAHRITLQRLQAATLLAGGTPGMADLYPSTIHFGERTVSYAQRRLPLATASGTGPGEGLLQLTTYGQDFVMLRSRNIFHSYVVSGPPPDSAIGIPDVIDDMGDL